MPGPITITSATPDDVPAILSMIRELAEYEKLLDRVTATEEMLDRSLFGVGSGGRQPGQAHLLRGGVFVYGRAFGLSTIGAFIVTAGVLQHLGAAAARMARGRLQVFLQLVGVEGLVQPHHLPVELQAHHARPVRIR